MAYSDYGAFVHLNAKRRRDKEDVGVYDTDEGSLFKRSEGLCKHHQEQWRRAMVQQVASRSYGRRRCAGCVLQAGVANDLLLDAVFRQAKND